MDMHSFEDRSTKMKIAVIGGSGFVGSNIARSLSSNFQIRILDMHPPPPDLAELEFQQCDVRTYDNVSKALLGTDLVVHTAIIQIPLITKMKRYAYEVNVLGTQNVCKAVDETDSIKGVLLTGSWHVMGERELQGKIDEAFGYRPEMVDSRAREYVLCKTAQEAIMNLYNQMSSKAYAIIRTGTVLGEGMPKETAANIFISNALDGKSITPFSHSSARPMLYVDIQDVCAAFTSLSRMILQGRIEKKEEDDYRTVNTFYPDFVTIAELAQIVKDSVHKISNGSIDPEIKIVDTGQPKQTYFSGSDKPTIDVTRAQKLLGVKQLTHPRVSIDRIVKCRMKGTGMVPPKA